MAEHERIARALAARDAPQLAALLRVHLEHKRRIVMAQLAAGVAAPNGAIALPRRAPAPAT
jgi:DNA-binding GntR family transcriptional regulator